MRRLLIDGNHLAGRCWATMGELTTSQGKYSGVLFGFLNGLSYIKHETEIDYPEIYICWDAGRCAKRMEIYPEYKGGRVSDTPTEQEIEKRLAYKEQLRALGEVLEYVGCRQVRVGGVEADDLIGILSKDFENQGLDTIIYSGDKDMHQLASERTKIFDPKAGLRDLKTLLADWQLPSTKHVLYYKVMTGDPSDNISGIGGFGDVKARKILSVMDFKDDEVIWTTPYPPGISKLVDKYKERSDIIKRNLSLVRLPRTWQDSYYSLDQGIEALQQTLTQPKRSEIKFVAFCRAWELTSIVEKLHRWS